MQDLFLAFVRTLYFDFELRACIFQFDGFLSVAKNFNLCMADVSIVRWRFRIICGVEFFLDFVQSRHASCPGSVFCCLGCWGRCMLHVCEVYKLHIFLQQTGRGVTNLG